MRRRLMAISGARPISSSGRIPGGRGWPERVPSLTLHRGMTRLRLDLDPGGGVVAGLLEGAHVAVHAGGDEAGGEVGAEQEVVDPDAGVAGEGVPEIVPVGVDRLVRVERAQGVGPALG